MRYLSGMQAMNVHLPGDPTPGDWHPTQDWEHLQTLDTTDSPFGIWGIKDGKVPEQGIMPVATHPRACLDLIAMHQLNLVQGMRETYISDENQTQSIMDQVWLLHDWPDWPLINNFMGYEYKMDWLDFLTSKNAEWPHGPKPTLADYQSSIKRFEQPTQ